MQFSLPQSTLQLVRQLQWLVLPCQHACQQAVQNSRNCTMTVLQRSPEVPGISLERAHHPPLHINT
eukprot:10794485-Prorocentrum_lima.AAC.1